MFRFDLQCNRCNMCRLVQIYDDSMEDDIFTCQCGTPILRILGFNNIPPQILPVHDGSKYNKEHNSKVYYQVLQAKEI